MRVAALYDIHGILPALEAVVAEVDRLRPDLILIGGDVAFGPMPLEALELLDRRGDRVRWIRGNADREVAGALDATPDPTKAWAVQARWCAEQITPEWRSRLAVLPTTTSIEIDGLGPTLFCHGSPRSDEEIITRISAESRLREILSGVAQPVVVIGHTHVQFDRSVLGKRLVNAGSVGLPYEETRGAYWALFGPGVELRRTTYDVDRAARDIQQTQFPDVTSFAQRMFIDPPSPSEVSERFEGMAIEADERARASRR